MKESYIYGPVPSRRLGFSLGVDLVPYKICSFDCIYCQLGRTTNKTVERKEYFPTDEILSQLRDAIKNNEKIDFITFSGSGEPALHSRIGYLIKEIKKITGIPVAVLTNGSLLFREDLQEELLPADVVLPSLCAATQEILNKVNRPHPYLNIDKIIQGQLNFRKKYRGKIWLEVMLVKGINDGDEEVRKIKEIVERMEPDRVQLNTVIRPPSEKFALPLSPNELERIRKTFGPDCEVIAEFKGKRKKAELLDKENSIFNLIQRRPATVDDLSKALGVHRNEAIKYLAKLQKKGKIKYVEHNNQRYYELTV